MDKVLGRKNVKVLDPEGWFELGHGIVGHTRDDLGRYMPKYIMGTLIWCPPPAAASVAAEELRRSRHKRESACHIFVCPRLMTNLWRKLVMKEADLLFELPAGFEVWREEMHEPLLIAVCLPLICHRPWRLAGTPQLLGMERELHRLREDPSRDPRAVLRQLCKLPGRLSTLSPLLVRKLLYTASR